MCEVDFCEHCLQKRFVSSLSPNPVSTARVKERRNEKQNKCVPVTHGLGLPLTEGDRLAREAAGSLSHRVWPWESILLYLMGRRGGAHKARVARRTWKRRRIDSDAKHGGQRHQHGMSHEGLHLRSSLL